MDTRALLRQVRDGLSSSAGTWGNEEGREGRGAGGRCSRALGRRAAGDPEFPREYSSVLGAMTSPGVRGEWGRGLSTGTPRLPGPHLHPAATLCCSR